jgi:tRNA A37 methylthiotransferase MiaB
VLLNRTASLEVKLAEDPGCNLMFRSWQRLSFSTVSQSLIKRKVYIEVYGCQMNTNDAEIVQGILSQNTQPAYEKCNTLEEADIVLLMTCAIRENAEKKIWNRLEALRAYEKSKRHPLTIGVLGCMAERLKGELLEKSSAVDLICGPDAYRDLPNLLNSSSSDRDSNINVSLSADETYADVRPVRLDSSKISAFVSIMRGCNNMCAFCIVPFVR